MQAQQQASLLTCLFKCQKVKREPVENSDLGLTLAGAEAAGPLVDRPSGSKAGAAAAASAIPAGIADDALPIKMAGLSVSCFHKDMRNMDIAVSSYFHDSGSISVPKNVIIFIIYTRPKEI